MTLMPFVCLAIGIVAGFRGLPDRIMNFADMTTNVALVILMLVIGANIGINSVIMENLIAIGLNCAAIAILAIAFSVFFTFLAEKTVLPLEAVRIESFGASGNGEEKGSPLIWIMPCSIIGGVVFGLFLMPRQYAFVLDKTLIASLVVLYISVGLSLGANRAVFKYIKLLGPRVLFLPTAILLGSLAGGLAAGLLLHVPKEAALLSAGGMSYYSITGAYMSQAYGVEIGIYGFVVNVMREFFTVSAMPLLVKISKGSPIAGGASGNMDTMLAPVTKFVGAELGLVTLFTGTVLTFLVPFLLPLLHAVLLNF